MSGTRKTSAISSRVSLVADIGWVRRGFREAYRGSEKSVAPVMSLCAIFWTAVFTYIKKAMWGPHIGNVGLPLLPLPVFGIIGAVFAGPPALWPWVIGFAIGVYLYVCVMVFIYRVNATPSPPIPKPSELLHASFWADALAPRNWVFIPAVIALSPLALIAGGLLGVMAGVAAATRLACEHYHVYELRTAIEDTYARRNQLTLLALAGFGVLTAADIVAAFTVLDGLGWLAVAMIYIGVGMYMGVADRHDYYVRARELHKRLDDQTRNRIVSAGSVHAKKVQHSYAGQLWTAVASQVRADEPDTDALQELYLAMREIAGKPPRGHRLNTFFGLLHLIYDPLCPLIETEQIINQPR